MTIPKTYLAPIVTLMLSEAFIGVVTLGSIQFGSFPYDLICSTIIFAMISFATERRSSIHIMFLIGFSVFMYAPALLNGYVFETPFLLYYYSASVAIYFLFMTDETVYVNHDIRKQSCLIIFLVLSVLFIILSLSRADMIYILSVYVMFFAIALRPSNIIFNLVLLFIFGLDFVIYMEFAWGGYGRTVTYGMLLTALLYFLYASELPVNRLMLSSAAVLGSMLLVGRKSFELEGLQAVLGDSAFGPYRLASSFLNYYDAHNLNVAGFLEQVVFTLLSFVPRAIWPSKPYGFGFQYVVDNMDSYLVDSGHSIASTLIGDHIYYLGTLGLLTGFLMAYVVAKLCNLFYQFKPLHGFGVAIFASNMMVFVWGGMTSLSARIIFPLIGLLPILIIYLFLRGYSGASGRRV